jgi:hypothetical protein
MMRPHPLIITLVFSTAVGVTGTARAQDAATANALFERGVADMEAGKFETACPAIQESQRIDPRPGTLFTLAECEAKWGKVASAVAHYDEYTGVVSRLQTQQQARHADRVRASKAAVARLKPTVPTLELVLPPDAPPGTTVKRDGVSMQGASLGLALPVDPGEHVIVSATPGGPEQEARVSVALGEAKRVVVEVRQADVATSPAPDLTAPAGQAPPRAGAQVGEPQGSSRSTWGYVAGGVGIAGVLVGTVAGILVFSKKSTVEDECVGLDCSPKGVEAASSGKTLAMVSNVGFGVGVAGLAVGAILLLTGSSSEAAKVGAVHVRPWLDG